ncbi:bactofilin family protein [Aromatoleum evansii]|uniref:bactofilin family protein n=1 Tax=Aromatoleum evansii TaxID=59406 RepID=UPI00145E8CF4|nr:polymer-forming cytoskeletal protein [Aromatoleum evansii]NMG30617.1 polymer-forming cytoskeletal protein [Aromatoleum evansii]
MTALMRREDTSAGFAAIRQDSAPSKLKINPQQERITTVLAASTCLEGTLRFEEGVKIDGRVKGDVIFGIEDGLCIVSAGAVVEGNLRGPKALIMGEVQGNVEVDTTLVLAPSAVVVGSVKCGRFVVYDGASVTGSIETIRQLPPRMDPQLEIRTSQPPAESDVVPFRRRLFGARR